MDGQRFDAMARAMAGGATRRRALRLAGGGLAGALLAAAGLGGRAQADTCKASGKACKKGGQCCSGNCAPVSGSRSTAHSASICCPAGQMQYPVGACSTPRFEVDSALRGGVDTGLEVLVGQRICAHATGVIDHGGVDSDPDGS